MKFNDVAEFRSGCLFDGAIDLDWYLNDRTTASKVSESYIFHGQKNHVGNTQNIKLFGQQSLTDSITMTNEIIDCINGRDPKMLLSIAGYGAGKSHFAIMIANLLNGDNITKSKILENIKFVNKPAALKIGQSVNESSQHVLILPINGMRNCNLQDEFLKVTKSSLKADGQSSEFLLKFDRRFQSLSHYLSIHQNKEMINEVIKESGCPSLDYVKDELNNCNLEIFELILTQLKRVDPLVPVIYSSNIELKDFIPTLYEEVCGEGKYYKSILIIFDEFGKYMMFAAEREHIAGNGIMQQLYEGIHAKEKASIVLWGLSQLDLKEYQDSTSTSSVNCQNNKNRYVTRFEAASRYYLSVSFESLISNLILIKDRTAYPNFDSDEIEKKMKSDNYNIRRWFPSSNNFHIWSNYDNFCKNIVKACWPLDSYSLWLIVYISSVNTILQQRSSLNLLRKVFDYFNESEINENFCIHATDFYNIGLGIEFSNSERLSGSNNQIATDYDTVIDKYNNQLSDNDISVLQAIVIANKIKTKSNEIEEAELIIEKLSGLTKEAVYKSFKTLKNKLNIIGQSLNNLYEINSNAPSYNEYKMLYNSQLSRYSHNSIEYNFQFIKDIVYSEEFSNNKNNLFTNCETDFGLVHNIRTLEWKYKSDILVSSNPQTDLNAYINQCDLLNNFSFNEPKGIILYTIIPETNLNVSLKEAIKKMLIEKRSLKNSRLPLIIVLLPDEDEKLINSSLQFKILKDFSKDKKDMFKVFFDKDIQDCINTTFNTIHKASLKKLFIADTDTTFKRKKDYATNLFDLIYSKIIPFPMEGFSTNKGCGVSDVKALIKALMTKNSSKSLLTLKTTTHNHCLEVLKCWGYFEKEENVCRMTNNDTINEVFNICDNILDTKGSMNLYDLYMTLCSCPFGLNSTASSLLTILYFLGRINRVDLNYNGKPYDIKEFLALKPVDWFDTKKNGFKKNYFSKLKIVKLVEGDNYWRLLIDDWKNASTYEDLVKCLEYDYSLTAEKHIQVPNSLVTTRDMLRDRSNIAKNKVNKLYQLINSYNQEFNNYINNGSVLMFSYNLNLYNKELTKIIVDKSKWKDETIEKAYEMINYFKNFYIDDKLKIWIKENSLYNLRDNNISKKQINYVHLITNLKELGLIDYSKILQIEYDECKKLLELQESYNSIIKNFDYSCTKIKRIIQNGGVYNYNIYLQLKTELNKLDKDINRISMDMLNKLSTNIDTERESLNNIKNSLNSINEAKENQLNFVYDIDIIVDVKEANNLYDKITSLKSYYIDNKDHLEELKDAEKAIKDIKNAFETIQNNFTSYLDLDNKYKKCFELIEFNDEELGLEYVKSLQKFYFKYLADLKKKSNDYYKWFNNQVSQVIEVSEMTKLISIGSPNYIVEEDEEKIIALKDQIKLKASREKVSYIVAQIKNLEDNELNQLKKLINNIL